MSGADIAHALGSATSRWYVDVAAVRIQAWLGRSAALRFRRGASYQLAQLTQQTSVEPWICEVLRQSALARDARLEWNPEAGQISGVVPLRFMADGHEEAEARAIAVHAATLIVDKLRSVIPACPFTGTWGQGTSYVEAYAKDMKRRILAGDILLDLPGGPEENFLARPCEMCRSAAAIHEQVEIIPQERPRDLCVDCMSRVKGAGFSMKGAGFSSSTDPEGLPKSQADLYRALNKTLNRDGSNFPADFSELAKLGRRDEDDAATQLALIFADGNRVGALLEEWLDRGGNDVEGQPVDKARIVKSLDAATKDSIADAVRRAYVEPCPASELPSLRPPVLVHLAGGDDILLSVPARDGWRFARLLLKEFQAEARKGLRPIFGKESPTLSIGLVFHHASHPFADVVAKAEAQLHHAKRSQRGMCAAIAFLDLTSDGEEPAGFPGAGASDSVVTRDAVTASELDGAAPLLDELVDVPASHRSRITQLLRESRHENPGRSGESAREALGRRVREMGIPPMLRAVTWPGQALPGSGVEPALSGPDPAARRRLRLYLDIARWWEADDSAGPIEAVPSGTDEGVGEP